MGRKCSIQSLPRGTKAHAGHCAFHPQLLGGRGAQLGSGRGKKLAMLACCVSTWRMIMPKDAAFFFFFSTLHFCEPDTHSGLTHLCGDKTCTCSDLRRCRKLCLRSAYGQAWVTLQRNRATRLKKGDPQGVKDPPANVGDARDVGSSPRLGRSPEGGNDNPLQYSCLENPMD